MFNLARLLICIIIFCQYIYVCKLMFVLRFYHLVPEDLDILIITINKKIKIKNVGQKLTELQLKVNLTAMGFQTCAIR